MNASQQTVSIHLIVVGVLLAGTLLASRVTTHRAGDVLASPMETIPLRLAGFEGVDRPPLQEGVLRELKATSHLSRSYTKGETAADVFIAYYAQQRAGESMHSPKHCLPGAGWEIWNYDTTRIPAGSQTVGINKYSIINAGDRRVVLYWYQSRREVFASEYLGKLLLARDALIRNSTAAAIVRIIVPDNAAAAHDAEAIASELVLQVRRCFGE